ncbi:MAG: aminopeptidase P family protein [Actinobacteria bacterium]|nr:aminopeptidase P family protein [Actinomycetota bacterium]
MTTDHEVARDPLDALRGWLEAEGLAAALVTSEAGVGHLCGFRFLSVDRLTALLVPRVGRPTLLVPEYEREAAAASVAGEEVAIAVWVDGEGPEPELGRLLGEPALAGPVAFELARLPVALLERMRGLVGGLDVRDCSEWLRAARASKTGTALEMVRRASAVCDRTVERCVAEALRPGVLETELSAELTRLLRLEGGDWTAFPPNVTSGPRSAFPHGPELSGQHGVEVVGARIELGAPVILDFSVIVGGYCADISRTYALDEADRRLRDIFMVVEESRMTAIQAIAPGVIAGEVDAAARGVIERHGYGRFFPQRTGHGLGLEIHETPDIAAGCADRLEPGMVMAIEPAIYIPGYGGVRNEDVVLVTDDGCEVLTNCSHQLVVESPDYALVPEATGGKRGTI